MSDHYNKYPLKAFARTVADCIGVEVTDDYAEGINWLSNLLIKRMEGIADRAVFYHADAVGLYMWQQYTNLFAPVYAHTSLAVPFLSTVESVTPVAHASMYTGLDPAGHGIQTYVRPELKCDTLYDRLIAQGRKVAIVAQTDSTFLHIFTGRKMDYFEEPNGISIQEKALDLLAKDTYDVVSIHTFEYDSAAHAYGPESKEGINAIALEAEGFARVASLMESFSGKHKTLLTYSPDHGQHPLEGGGGAHGSKLIEDMNILHFFGAVK